MFFIKEIFLTYRENSINHQNFLNLLVEMVYHIFVGPRIENRLE